MLDAVVLNRNLGQVCDDLVDTLVSSGVDLDCIQVVDAGSQAENLSQFTTVFCDDEVTRRDGLRFCRGMNRGLQARKGQVRLNEWVALLPVDTQLLKWDYNKLTQQLTELPEVAVVAPLEKGSPYESQISGKHVVVAWALEDGPLLLRQDFVEQLEDAAKDGRVFDEANERGVYYFLDLAFRAYVRNRCVIVTDLLLFQEDESLLRNHAEFIRTDSYEVNQRVLDEAGATWLGDRYGTKDVWEFSNVVRLLHEEFLTVNPHLRQFGVDFG